MEMTGDFEYQAAAVKVFRETSGLDTALETLARIAVPALADACAIQVLDGFQNVESVTVARLNADAGGRVAVAQTRTPDGQTRSPSHSALLKELSAGSSLVLPMASRGGVLGSIAFGLSHPGGFSPDQVLWAEEFARGVSLGVENARLARIAARLERERESAEAARARAEAALSEGESMLRILVENHLDMTCLLESGPDRSYRFALASPALLSAMGLAALDWKGRAFEELFPDATAEFLRGMCDQVMAGGHPLEREGESLFAPGRWEHTLYSPIRNHAGDITHIIISARDVTALKNAQREAATSRDLLRAALASLPDPVIILDASGRGLYANLAHAQSMGFAGVEEDLASGGEAPDIRYSDEDDIPIPGEAMPGALARRGESPEPRLVKVQVPGRGPRWLRIAARPLRDETGKVAHVILNSVDVTPLKDGELAACAREAELRHALDVGRVGLWDFDLESHALSWSGCMAEIHGLSPEDCPRSEREFFALLHPGDREKMQAAARAAAEKDDDLREEFRIIRPGGSVRWHYTTGSAVKDAAGKPIRLVGATIDVTDRKQSEAELARRAEKIRALAELLQSTLDVLPHPVIVFDADGKPEFRNLAHAQALGLSSVSEDESRREERIAALEFHDETGLKIDTEGLVRKALRGEATYAMLLRQHHPEGGPDRWFEIAIHPIFDPAGKVRRVVGTSHEMTALKIAHAEARRSRELMDAALDASQDALAILDANGRIFYRNQAAERFMGLAPSGDRDGSRPAGARSRIEALDEAGNPVAESDLPSVRVLRGEAPSASCILQLRDRDDGRVRWVENKAAAARDEWGRVKHVVDTMVDITRLKAAQEGAAAQSERLRVALEVGRVGVWDLDLRTDQLAWSERMCAMHGRLPGHPPRSQAEFLALIHAEDRERVMAAFLESEGRSHFEVEYRLPGRYGEVRWIYSAGGYLKAQNGAALRFMGAALEITERKRAEEATLEMQNRVRMVQHMDSIGRMAGGMSHDFNNLLTAINGYAELILSSADQDSIRGFAASIRESGERAVKITQQLLAYSQRQLLETEVADVNLIVRYMIDLIRKLVDDGIQVYPVLSPAPEPIRVDPGKLKQALLHVVMNALDAMPQGGRLTLSTFFTRLPAPVDSLDQTIPAGDFVIIEVADTGAGIEPEILPRIFEPYFTTKPMGVKSGLGLSMVQGIVKQHGGHIQVTSERGVGTRFRIYFPPADQSLSTPAKAR